VAISKEEKAVRAALAQLEKDAAVSDAAVARMNQATPVSSYEQARSQLSEIKDPKIRAAAEKAFAGVDRQTERLTTEAAKVGLQVTPSGTLAPAAPTGTTLTPEQIAAQIAAAQAASASANAAEIARQQQAAEAERLRRAGQSAYDVLFTEFNQYGLGSLVEPLKGLIMSGPSSAELTLALRATDAYQKRFAANAERIKKGLTALPESVYVGLEDKYQGVMRNYGLPATYYSKDTTGRQVGFEQLIANDVSSTELEERILTAQQRVLNAPPEVATALKQFYPDITNGDILGYVLDPSKGLTDIKRKVTAAEIGGAAIGAKLQTTAGRAEELASYGVTSATARQGFSAISSGLERGRQLSGIYQQDPYTQLVAEEEIFALSGQAEASKKRKKLIGAEKAEFSGQTGITSGALGRDRAGSF
jgi:hypothetical protein